MKDKKHIFGSIFVLAQQWQNTGDQILLKRVGITSKQWMLLALLENEFQDHLPTISEAAKTYGTTRQNLKQIVDALQKKGFVLIARDPNDQRINRIALTGKHKQLFHGESNYQWQHEFINRLFIDFDPEELKNLGHKIDKLLNNIYTYEQAH